MASEVDVCNVALSHLGDSATVASISPPDGSAQADLCARFYPIARDSLIEMNDWGFATRRVALAQQTNISTTWLYCYAQPADLVNPISVLYPDAADDTSSSIGSYIPSNWSDTPAGYGVVYTPQPYQLESAADGTDILYTNVQNAVLRYVAQVTDTTKFSPLFIRTLAASLASLLAGPILKGMAGDTASARWHGVAFGRDGKSGWFGQAAASDANQKKTQVRERHQVSWINSR